MTITEAKIIVRGFPHKRILLEHYILALELHIQEINFKSRWTSEDRQEYDLCKTNFNKGINQYREEFAADPISQHIECDIFGAREFRDFLAELG